MCDMLIVLNITHIVCVSGQMAIYSAYKRNSRIVFHIRKIFVECVSFKSSPCQLEPRSSFECSLYLAVGMKYYINLGNISVIRSGL